MSLVYYSNNRRVRELNPLMQDMLYDLFDNIDNDSVVYARENYTKSKGDFFVTIGSIQKIISLKLGDNGSFHLEPISEFIHFLILNKIPRDIIVKYLKFQYADGTTNGSGNNRISVQEYKKEHQQDIELMNKYFNNEKFIKECIYRFVLKGREKGFEEIDALICGRVNDFVYIKKHDIISIILSHANLNSTGLHVGSLFIQPQSRNLNYNVKYEKCRFCVQIKWFNFFDQVIEYKNNLVSIGK